MADAVSEVTARLRKMQEAATTTAPMAAVRAMSLLGVVAVQAELSASSHPIGAQAAPPPAPPAHVTGKLARSVVAAPPVMVGGKAVSTVGATTKYARIQELGGVVTTRRAKLLHWVDDSGDNFAKKVTLPARPYLAPATRKLITSGKLREVAARAFIAAVFK